MDQEKKKVLLEISKGVQERVQIIQDTMRNYVDAEKIDPDNFDSLTLDQKHTVIRYLTDMCYEMTRGLIEKDHILIDPAKGPFKYISDGLEGLKIVAAASARPDLMELLKEATKVAMNSKEDKDRGTHEN